MTEKKHDAKGNLYSWQIYMLLNALGQRFDPNALISQSEKYG